MYTFSDSILYSEHVATTVNGCHALINNHQQDFFHDCYDYTHLGTSLVEPDGNAPLV